MGNPIVSLDGNCGKKPEMRYTQQGVEMVTWSVAASVFTHGRKVTQWWDLIAFGEVGTRAQKYLDKGSYIKIIGELQCGEDGKPITYNGKPKWGVKVIFWDFLGKKSESDDSDHGVVMDGE